MQAADPILDEIVAENDVDVDARTEEEEEEEQEEEDGESEGSEWEEKLDGDGDEVRQRIMGEIVAEEGVKEIGDYGYGGDDDSLMDEMAPGDFGEVPEDDRSTTDKDDNLDKLGA